MNRNPSRRGKLPTQPSARRFSREPGQHSRRSPHPARTGPGRRLHRRPGTQRCRLRPKPLRLRGSFMGRVPRIRHREGAVEVPGPAAAHAAEGPRHCPHSLRAGQPRAGSGCPPEIAGPGAPDCPWREIAPTGMPPTFLTGVSAFRSTDGPTGAPGERGWSQAVRRPTPRRSGSQALVRNQAPRSRGSNVVALGRAPSKAAPRPR